MKRKEALEQAKRLRREYRSFTHPHMREITDNLRRKHGTVGLICPICGDRDYGNTINGRPSCVKCYAPLMTAENAANWVKPVKPRKPSSYTFTEPEGITKRR